MAYIVTRTVNGKQYRYLQESYRGKSGTVRTRTIEYLGPVNPVYKTSGHKKKGAGSGTGALNKHPKPTKDRSLEPGPTSTNSREQARHHSGDSPRHGTEKLITTEILRESITTPLPIATCSAIHRAFARNGSSLNPRPGPSTLSLIHKRTDLSHRRVNLDRLNQESKKFVAVLESKGASPDGSIKFKWGSELKSKQKGKHIVISTPNQASPTHLRREVHKAHARLAIKALKKACPAEFNDLSLEAKATFEISKTCYAEALKLGKDWRKQFKAIGVRRFGNFEKLEKNFRDPQKWGIYHYERKKSWKDDMVSLYAEAESQGGLYRFAKSLRREQQQAGAIAAKLESERGTGRDEALDREIQRANLRFAILAENVRKLPTLNALFYANYGTFPLRKLPAHDESQKRNSLGNKH